MSAFTLIVILCVLMIIGGFFLMSAPFETFISTGHLIITLFFIVGLVGVIRGIRAKRYDKGFFLSILSLVLGLVGLFVPGAAEMNNYVLLYMAACWFFLHGILTIVGAVESKKKGTDVGWIILGVVLGLLEIVMACYSVAHPSVLAVSLGMLIGFYFVETGVNMLIVSTATCEGGNSMTVLYTVMGILTIISGICMLFTPLLTFLSVGYCIIILFFLNGILGIVLAIATKRYGKEFWFAIASLIFGIIGLTVPGVAEMNNSILLYLASAWFLIHGILTIVDTIELKKNGAESRVVVTGIILGVLELVIAVYSVMHPSVLAVSLGILIGLYFIESGVDMIYIGSTFAKAVAVGRVAKRVTTVVNRK